MHKQCFSNNWRGRKGYWGTPIHLFYSVNIATKYPFKPNQKFVCMASLKDVSEKKRISTSEKGWYGANFFFERHLAADTRSLSRDCLQYRTPPCLASLFLPLQNLKSGHNIYIPTMDFLWSGQTRGSGYRVVELCGWSSLARSGHCALWLSGPLALWPPQGVSSRPRRRHLGRHLGWKRHHCHPNARWRHTLGSSSSSWSLVSRTLR